MLDSTFSALVRTPDNGERRYTIKFQRLVWQHANRAGGDDLDVRAACIGVVTRERNWGWIQVNGDLQGELPSGGGGQPG